VDTFAKYKRCLSVMASKLPERDLESFHMLRGRLTEAIDDATLYGDSEQQRADRAKVLHALNRLAMASFGKPFDAMGELALPVTADSTLALDVAVYVALSEEFATVLEEVGPGFEAVELRDVALTLFRGAIQARGSSTRYNVGIIPAGKMGNTRAANVMSAILSRGDVKNVVVLGIAGTLTDDLQPGDVFIPDSVSEYLANSAVTGQETFSFTPSGNHFPTDPRLLNRFQLCRTRFKREFARWESAPNTSWASSLGGDALAALHELGINADAKRRLVCGDDRILASGPAVAKGLAFVRWLKNVDRKVSAIEMESAGVCDASFIRTPGPRTIAIRGISDYADERKEQLERVSKGFVRVAAVRNATALLVWGLQMGLFAPAADCDTVDAVGAET